MVFISKTCMLYTHITPKVLVMSHTLKVIWSLYKKTCILYTHITPKVFVITVVNHIHHCSIMIYKFANVSNYIVVRTFECVDYNFAWLSVYVLNFHYIILSTWFHRIINWFPYFFSFSMKLQYFYLMITNWYLFSWCREFPSFPM